MVPACPRLSPLCFSVCQYLVLIPVGVIGNFLASIIPIIMVGFFYC